MTVYAPGVAGESPVFADALTAAPKAAKGVHFVGVWIPGMNRIDYAGLHAQATSSAFFVSPDLRASFEAGRVDYRPLSYHATYVYLRDRVAVDLALVHVAPPDDNGLCSLGVANDFTPAILDKARITVAHVNPEMPRTRGAVAVPFDALDHVVEAPAPLLGEGAGSAGPFAAIGEHVAGLVADGDTIEVGVGRLQAILPALADKRRLAIHAGIVCEPALALVESGALVERDGGVTVGVAWGTEALYDFCARDPRVRFAPVGWTHDIRTLAGIERFVAVNSVIEVDLFGQANAETVDGRQISSAGGLVDFMRGARASAGGRAIVALQATAKRGAVSRIVPELPAGTPVSVARGDMEIVVTEHGVADLRNRTIDERAAALIAIAAPEFRDGLADAWAARRKAM